MNPPHVVVASTRRFWSAAEKRAILAEARETTTSVSAVARRHGVHASLLFRWAETVVRQLSGGSDLAKAFRYMLVRWTALTRVFDDGRIALDNNPAERVLRSVAIGRKNYLFAGSDRGADRAAAFYTLIETAKLNGLDPEAYLRDVLTRIADYPVKRLAELLPWNWSTAQAIAEAA